MAKAVVFAIAFGLLGGARLMAQNLARRLDPPNVPSLPSAEASREPALPRFGSEVSPSQSVLNFNAPVDGQPVVPTPPRSSGLTLQDIERLALNNHPAIRVATERRLAAYGDWVQAGLKPNPTVGYMGGEIGIDGTTGQQGGYVQQRYIRGNKLGLNRAVRSHRMTQLDQAILKQQMQVVRDARRAFFDLKVEQEKLKILNQLLALLVRSEATAKRLSESNESPRTDYLQAKIQTARYQLDRQTAEVNVQKAERVLATRLGLRDLPSEPIQGDVTSIHSSLVFNVILAEVEMSNPDVIIALAKVQEARCQLARERAEVIPDLSTQASVQYDDGSGDMFAGVQTGIELKLWNRNQGGILRAQRTLSSAEEAVQQVRLELRSQLAESFAAYDAAKSNVQKYETSILPEAAETNTLVERAYRNGESNILAVLTAQQTFFQTSLGYMNTIRDYWNGWTDVNAMLPISIDQASQRERQ